MNFTEPPYDRCQINFNLKQSGTGEILERSCLVNIRTPSLEETLDIYRSLRRELGSELGNYQVETVTTPQLSQRITTPTVYRSNQRIERNEPEDHGMCKDCGARMIRKYSKRNSSWFLSCLRYPNCRHTESIDQ